MASGQCSIPIEIVKHERGKPLKSGEKTIVLINVFNKFKRIYEFRFKKSRFPYTSKTAWYHSVVTVLGTCLCHKHLALMAEGYITQFLFMLANQRLTKAHGFVDIRIVVPLNLVQKQEGWTLSPTLWACLDQGWLLHGIWSKLRRSDSVWGCGCLRSSLIEVCTSLVLAGKPFPRQRVASTWQCLSDVCILDVSQASTHRKVVQFFTTRQEDVKLGDQPAKPVDGPTGAFSSWADAWHAEVQSSLGAPGRHPLTFFL